MEQSDPSFNLIVVSDLAPGSPGALRARAVDKDSLDALLRELGPSIEVPAGGGRTVVTFQEFKDFRPERLAARVPALAQLLEFRKQAQELAAGSGSVEAVRASLQKLGAYPDLARALEAALQPSAPKPREAAPAPKAAPIPTGSLEDLVDLGSAPAADAVSPEQIERTTANLIDAVIGSSSAPKPAPAALRAVGAQAEAAVAPMLRAVLHDPRFRELEAAWRGLRMLVRSVDFRSGCRLHVVAAPRSALLHAVRETALPLADDLRSQGKTSCLLLDFTFDGSEDELVAIAEDAAARSLPAIASAGLEVAVRELAAGLGDASQGAWLRLRSAPAARWLALAANRFLLRVPYGAAGDPPKNLAFEELQNPETPLPWGRAGWLLAALIAGSVAKTGWGCDFSGRDAAAGVEPLPMRPGEADTTPLETDLTDAAAHALGDAGLLPLACRRGNDRPFAAGSGTVYKPKKDESATSLRYALFAAPIAAAMESLLGQIDMTYSVPDIAKTIGAALQLLGMTEEGPLFTATAAASSGGRPVVDVRIRPQGGVLRGLPDLTFEVPIVLH
ncbi:MAG TPA: type VI secretion system contractile sheath large subunit [Planctomycetota bacterium]|jgi:type VI secretion system protein ImpC|nr:type VI secretion system contractile sheath large subunit [Planctomycetota bacterium]